MMTSSYALPTSSHYYLLLTIFQLFQQPWSRSCDRHVLHFLEACMLADRAQSVTTTPGARTAAACGSGGLVVQVLHTRSYVYF